MIFAPIRPAILQLIKDLAGTGVDVVWRDQTARYVPTGTKTVCKLSLGPVNGLGKADRKLSYDATKPQGQEMAETIAEHRRFILKILCECFDQTDGATAWNYLETIRTRLGWDSSIQVLLAVNVSIYGDADLQDLSLTVDNRTQSKANLDIRLATVAQETDEQHRFGYIETVDPQLDITG